MDKDNFSIFSRKVCLFSTCNVQ